ncbi:bifunctional 2-polyprenyl-6-hydroxyphenol methylase/3-demethylubiquinol 3-O-methyltransferase UbiG [Amycolatopsis sp. 195334CR]|uniref:class I SAM-dependent methyltransferase n=1 Tax=Amycolatopsis sp. 195334CR TaxID=2814588 RepID=UPI001A8C21CA|nr:class I SAM-dependent methyltransferase [Amycolatopsis sp. 195334CR]MBN6037413.1 methyltransferase domain-containing protein [Amycolatopsis sp. 195334CR]
MPFNHNDHYHPYLLRQVPPGARRALDVGCGTGRFARRLAARGLEVDGIDPAAEVVDVATALGGEGVTYRCGDVTTEELPAREYDFISCLASLHHMPFSTVARLRDALAPGGVLAVLGCANPSGPRDWLPWLASVPVNLVARAVVATGERLNGGLDPLPTAPIRDWSITMAEIRRESAELLPGRTVRAVPFWRYVLLYRQP